MDRTVPDVPFSDWAGKLDSLTRGFVISGLHFFIWFHVYFTIPGDCLDMHVGWSCSVNDSIQLKVAWASGFVPPFLLFGLLAFVCLFKACKLFLRLKVPAGEVPVPDTLPFFPVQSRFWDRFLLVNLTSLLVISGPGDSVRIPITKIGGVARCHQSGILCAFVVFLCFLVPFDHAESKTLLKSLPAELVQVNCMCAGTKA